MTYSIDIYTVDRPANISLEVRNRLRELGTGPVCDACPDCLVLEPTIKPLGSYACQVGLAFPLDTGPADNLTLWTSLKYARQGDVLLVATHRCQDASVFGDLFVGFAKNAGVSAIITDGCIRDYHGIVEVGLPVLATNTSPRAPQKNGPGTIGLPIQLGGCLIEPDMVVVTDRDGTILFDRKYLPETLKRLEKVEAKESQGMAQIAAKRIIPTWMEDLIEEITSPQ